MTHPRLPRQHTRLLSFAAVALMLTACSLAGDITPPPAGGGVPTLAPSEPTATTVAESSPLFPAAAPIAIAGGQLYLEHCTPCHGDRGAGGGSMAAQLPGPVPDFSNPATLSERTPQALFATITHGRLEALMPPFGDTLSDEQRWSLVAFLYTLSTPPEQLAVGQAVYTLHCKDCHGAEGQGDGPDAAGRPMPNFADQEFMVNNSQQDFYKAIFPGDAVHPFAGLSEADRWGSLDAVRAMSYIYSAPGELTAERQGELSGQVVNKTPGFGMPAGLSVSVFGYEGQDLFTTLTTTIGADGAFAFDAVPFRAGRQFVATTTYNNITYASPVGTFDLSSSALALSLPIYETTDDTAALAAEQVHLFLEFLTPDELTVGELVVFSNTGGRAYSATSANPLRFSLPAGATSLTVQDAQPDTDFVRTADGFTLLWSVPPGSATTQVLYSYKLPYSNGLKLEERALYPITSVNLLVSDLGIRVTGPNLQALGQQNFQGRAFQNFTRTALAPGETLTVELSGAVGAAPGAASNLTGSLVGAGALLAALAAVSIWYFRRPAVPQPAQRKEGLLQDIADLDDEYDAGKISAADYRVQRAKLKAELTRLWGQAK